jgi:hypothetical protein
VLAGIVAFYKDFVEALYENLRGQASVTGEHGSCIFCVSNEISMWFCVC